MESPKEISNSESTHIGSAIREKHREEKYTNNVEMEINMENEENIIVQEEEHHKVRGTPDGKTRRIDKMQLIEVNKKQDEKEEDGMEESIEQIGREGDLSPRQIGQLKGRHKKKYSNTDEDWEEQHTVDSVQQLTISFKHKRNHNVVKIIEVYARCSALERLELWEDLEDIANNIIFPWIVGGDFNTIMHESEKLGGLPITQNETIDFIRCINTYALNELKFIGSCYTWWNGQIEEDCIFKRLDRVFGNNEFMNTLQGSEVHHLIREGSDHAPLHVRCNNVQEQIRKPFRFLNFWFKHKDFVKVVGESWKKDTQEDVIKAKEAQLEINPTTENRIGLKKAKADLERYINIEEEYWKQKDGMRWFQNGDRNTKFFHAYVQGRRRKLHISAIQTMQGDLISSTENIGAVNVFREQFTKKNEPTDYAMLENIPNIISNEQNEEMERLPTEDEVKNVVFALNGDSASGPDGYSGQFFQSCWEIVKQDIINMVKACYCGMEMPRFITHTNLILIPQKETVNNFGV
ncbi:hypothetical protein H5410_005352 [Solanum commersonii]|uniref:Uncharacterized protein n=1 Tax=Solanum commersonii TaxID=4109 RepID=A0A9J6A665_SOLCO|nr:hypothetical protein H5410_005352 [Solanum commersonii]